MHRYRINRNSILIIEENAYKKLVKYCQDKNQDESGGILLGKAKKDYSKIVVSDISEPCENDSSGRYFFVRNKDNAQKIINKNWELSNGITNYLGEWHTHLEVSPIPSTIDKKLIRKCIKENVIMFNCLFLIIVGINGELFVGYRTKKMNKLRKLNRVIIREEN